MVASAAIHGLIVVSLWHDGPRHTGEARYADVMVDVIAAEQEQSVSKHQIKAAIEPEQPPSHPAAPGIAKKMPNPLHIHRSTPILPSPDIADKPANTSLPVQTAALAASAAFNPAISRQVQQQEQKGIRDAVRKHLETFKYYPASARRRGIEGDVDVVFNLTHGGVAEQVTVLKGSGYAVLDRAAIMTVARAQPFPVENGQYRFRLRFRRL